MYLKILSTLVINIIGHYSIVIVDLVPLIIIIKQAWGTFKPLLIYPFSRIVVLGFAMCIHGHGVLTPNSRDDNDSHGNQNSTATETYLCMAIIILSVVIVTKIVYYWIL